MKKHSTLIMSTLALFCVAACSDDEQEEVPVVQEITDIRVVAPDFVPDTPESRLGVDVSKGFFVHWTENDTIGILPDVGAQVPFPLDVKAGEVKQSITFTGGGWALKSSSTYAAYYPYVSDIKLDRTAIPLRFDGQWQRENGGSSHLSPYVHMASVATTPENGGVDFKFQHLGCLVWLEINTPEPMSLGTLDLIADRPVFVREARLDLSNPTLTLSEQVLTDTMSFALEGVSTTADNLKANLYFLMAPVDLTACGLRAVVHDIDGYAEEVQLEGRNMQAGKAYKYGNLAFVTHPQVAAPQWTFDEASSFYQAGMTAVVTLPSSMRKFMGEGDELAAFIGGELRGVGKRIGDAYYLVVHGNIGESGRVTFQYFNQKKKYLYEAKDVVDFNSDNVYGTADHPQELPLKVVK